MNTTSSYNGAAQYNPNLCAQAYNLRAKLEAYWQAKAANRDYEAAARAKVLAEKAELRFARRYYKTAAAR